MRVLVTGGAGFIGSHLVDALLRDGRRVRVLDNLSSGHRENLPATHPLLEFIEGDIRDRDTVSACARGVDAVVHLAAVASVQASVEDPIGTHETNLDGTLHVLLAAQKAGARRFLYASSAAVYGDAQRFPICESAPLAPVTPYAIDKLAGEYYLAYFGRRYGLSTTAFRFFNIYGPRQDPSSPYSGVISIFVQRLRERRSLTIFGDGRQTRDFVYVDDLVRILVRSLDDASLSATVVNVGTGIETSIKALVTDLQWLTGEVVAIEHAAARPGDIIRSCADVTRLRRLFGSAPMTTTREGLYALLDSMPVDDDAVGRLRVAGI